MAIALASSATTSPASSSTLTITKPTGLAAGDVLVAHVSADASNNFSTPSGWTSIVSELSDALRMRVYWKVADSTDAAATNFSFSTTGGASNVWGGLIRVTGATTIDVTNTALATNSTNTNKVVSTVTPTLPSLLFLILASHSDSATRTFSTYAMVTDNPTWSEAYDFGGSNLSSACGYAVRTATTATGDISYSVSGAGATSDTVSAVVVFSDRNNVSNAPTVLTVNADVITPIFSITISATINAPTTTTTALPTNVSKSTTTWTNISKS